jgi:uncharacterized lipoprotein YmbA
MLLLGLVACGSAPPVHFQTLMPAEIGVRASVPGQSPVAITLENIRLPAQVDQPQWLVRLPDDSLAVLEQERWASPLRDEFRQALLEELLSRYGVIDVRTRGTDRVPVIRVAVDVRRFDSIPGREARTEGSWSLLSSAANARASRCEWLLREPAVAGMPALAEAHRRAIVRLGDAIGDNLIRLRRGEPVSCPPLDATK